MAEGLYQSLARLLVPHASQDIISLHQESPSVCHAFQDALKALTQGLFACHVSLERLRREQRK